GSFCFLSRPGVGGSDLDQAGGVAVQRPPQRRGERRAVRGPLVSHAEGRREGGAVPVLQRPAQPAAPVTPPLRRPDPPQPLPAHHAAGRAPRRRGPRPRPPISKPPPPPTARSLRPGRAACPPTAAGRP